jgi:CheY-like chemotaxis protein
MGPIFLADNEPIILRVVSEFLRDLGHETTLAASGDELLTLLKNQPPPSVIIIDLMMPGWSAPALLEKIHLLQPTVPIVVMSQQSQTIPTQDAIANGIHAYLRKPIILSELEILLLRIDKKKESENTENQYERAEIDRLTTKGADDGLH